MSKKVFELDFRGRNSGISRFKNMNFLLWFCVGRNVILIKKAQKEDLEEILKLQYLAYQSEAKLFGDIDIPPLK